MKTLLIILGWIILMVIAFLGGAFAVYIAMDEIVPESTMAIAIIGGIIGGIIIGIFYIRKKRKAARGS